MATTHGTVFKIDRSFHYCGGKPVPANGWMPKFKKGKAYQVLESIDKTTKEPIYGMRPAPYKYCIMWRSLMLIWL